MVEVYCENHTGSGQHGYKDLVFWTLCARDWSGSEDLIKSVRSRFSWHLNSTLSPGFCVFHQTRLNLRQQATRSHYLSQNLMQFNLDRFLNQIISVIMFIFSTTRSMFEVLCKVDPTVQSKMSAPIFWLKWQNGKLAQGRVGSISQNSESISPNSKSISPKWLFSNLEKFRLCHRNVSNGGES